MTIATSRQGETVDAVCWRVLWRTAAVTEQVLEMNRGLAELGPILPAGTQLILPDLAAAAPEQRDTVQLWS